MSDREEFEKWLKDEGLDHCRLSSVIGWKAWQAARAQGGEAVAEIHKFGYGRRRTTVRHIRDLAKYPEGTKLYLSHEQQE